MATPYQTADGTQVDPATQGVKDVRNKLKAGLSDRRKYEVNWKLNLAYARDESWTVVERESRTLRTIDQLDPRYKNRELYKSNIINEYRNHTLGELGSDDARPQLLLSQDDITADDYQKQLNRAMQFAWDYEIEAEEVLAIADRICVDLGVAAIRCSYDPTVGAVKEQGIPHVNGLPVWGDEAVQAVAQAAAAGKTLEYKDVRAGKLRWEAITPFQMITPPGITHEREFPWEGVCSIMPVAEARAMFPALGEIKEDKDIGSDMGQVANQAGRTSRVRDHVWVYTYYERPTPDNEKGRVLYFVGADMRFAGNVNRLPYQDANGTYCSGIVYFHYHRTTGVFWSLGLIDPLRDPQRAMNKRRTQMNEIIDKGMPFVLVNRPADRAEIPSKQTDLPLEQIEISGAMSPPQLSSGIGPGQWMYQELESIRLDAERSVGIRGPSLGENPTNVNTYSQLALLKEADATKRQASMRERQMGIKTLTELTAYDIRAYKGEEWHIALAGDEGIVEAHNFNATKIPTFFIVHVPKGDAKPRSQAAELQKVQDIWQAALGSGVTQNDPSAWIRWYDSSLNAGIVLELPDVGEDVHGDKARRENHKLMEGEDVAVADYDPPEIHLPIHREQQIKAEQADDWAAWKRIEQHCQEHTQIAMAHAQQAQQLAAQHATTPVGSLPDDTLNQKMQAEQAQSQADQAQQQADQQIQQMQQQMQQAIADANQQIQQAQAESDQTKKEAAIQMALDRLKIEEANFKSQIARQQAMARAPQQQAQRQAQRGKK